MATGSKKYNGGSTARRSSSSGSRKSSGRSTGQKSTSRSKSASTAGRNGSRKSTASSRTGTRKSAGAVTGSARKGTTGRGRGGYYREEPNEKLRNELLLLLLFAAMALLFLSNFGIMGSAGNILSGALFGLFGFSAYLVPIAAFSLTLFAYLCREKESTPSKIAAIIGLLVVFGILCEMVSVDLSSQPSYQLIEIYQRSSQGKSGGGVLGGSIAFLLYKLLRTVGTVLMLIVLTLVCVIIITERSLLEMIKDGFADRDPYDRWEEEDALYEEEEEQERVQAQEPEEESIPFEEGYQAYKRSRQERKMRREEEARLRTMERERERALAEKQHALEKEAKENNRILRMDHKATGITPNTLLTEEPGEAYGQAYGQPDAERQQVGEEILQSQGTSAEPSMQGEIYNRANTVGKRERDGAFEPDVPIMQVKERPKDISTVEGGLRDELHEITVNDLAFQAMQTPVSPLPVTAASYAGIGVVHPGEAAPDYTSDAFAQRIIHQGYVESAESERANAGQVDYGLTYESVLAQIQANAMEDTGETIGEMTETSGEEHPISVGEWNSEESVQAPSYEDTSVAREWDRYVSPTQPVYFENDSEKTQVTAEAIQQERSADNENVLDNSRIVSDNASVNNASDISNIDNLGNISSYTSSVTAPQSEYAGTPKSERVTAPSVSAVTPQSSRSDEQVQPSVTAVAQPRQIKPEDLEQIAVHRDHPQERKPAAAPSRSFGDILQRKYQLPPTSLLKKGEVKKNPESEKELKETAIRLQETLRTFGVNVTITDISQGPTVTRYELQPEVGVKVSRIVSLQDDIKLNLAATDIRIEAPIPGKAAIGIEVPNREITTVSFRELVESEEFQKSQSRLSFAVGKDIGGKTVVTDIAKMPHLLIAGSTGSGKSVCINTLIMSILYKAKPEDVKLIMVDPKVVELSVYNGIPHLLIPVVTDPRKAAAALNWAVAEMDRRYGLIAKAGSRDVKGYNEAARKDPTGEMEILPQIVIVVDELADLMMVAANDVEKAICRLAQLARAAGLHLIIATQRPSVDVITGLIKANMPSRIAFAVSSGVDSRTILDMNGAEKLLGKGDMLFAPQSYPKPARIQGAFISDQEVSDVVDFLAKENINAGQPNEIEKAIENIASGSTGVENGTAAGSRDDSRDEHFAEAGRFIIEKDKASIGMLQRYYKIGFNRAARIMDQLCEAGVVSAEEGTKPRKVLMSIEEFEAFLESEES